MKIQFQPLAFSTCRAPLTHRLTVLGHGNFNMNKIYINYAIRQKLFRSHKPYMHNKFREFEANVCASKPRRGQSYCSTENTNRWERMIMALKRCKCVRMYGKIFNIINDAIPIKWMIVNVQPLDIQELCRRLPKWCESRNGWANGLAATRSTEKTQPSPTISSQPMRVWW